MIKIYLADFIDIVSASGAPKANKVKQVKNRRPYSPQTDYYKGIRDCITDVHVRNLAKSSLTSFLGTVTDQKKVQNYTTIAQGYNTWWGNKNINWFQPARGSFVAPGIGIEVVINPELGLDLGGQRHLIKLYFKQDELKKNRIDITTHMMDSCLRSFCQPNDIMSVLDTRKPKLISPTVPIANLTAMLTAELAYIENLWPNV